jgi:N-acyl-D-amino-acid deacylase
MKRTFCLLAYLFSIPCFAASFDLIIQHGRVVDGTGSPSVTADVGIRDGRVAEIGKLDASMAKRVIDASGLIVAPGFIDVHTHAEDILELPEGQNFIRMGVTTLMLGNCGGSSLDVDKFLQKVSSTNVCPNIATLIGHNTVRRNAMGGSFDRVPTVEELERMRQLVRTAMNAGAFGLSTGLIYLPGTFSKTEEIIELAKVAAEFGGIYASHMRDESLEISSSLQELFRIAREGGIRAHISHIKLSGKSAWNRAGQVLEMIETARGEGLDITQDQYVYTASSTGISQLVPDWAREGDKFDQRLQDPTTKARMKEEMRSSLKRRGFNDFSYAIIANYPDRSGTIEGQTVDNSLNGLNIVEAAQKKRGAASLDDQMELILEIQSRASGVFHSISEEDLQIFLKHPNTMLASDSGVRKFQQGVPHPRGYGNNVRALHRYVNELHILRLEEAIRRMTSLPANTFRLANRGQLHEGFWADLVVFDPKTVSDRATFTEPHQYPVGVEYVLVNGAAVFEKGRMTSERPGRALRFRGE